MYIAICDNDENVVNVLRNKVASHFQQNNVIADIKSYTQSRQLQQDIIKEGKRFDLILSDIEMSQLNGMQMVSHIKKYLPNVLIIFITSHMEYVLDAFELSIFRYIPKDSVNFRLPKALDDATCMIQFQSEKYYVIHMSKIVKKIPYSEMRYIQREGKNVLIALADGTVIKIRKSLKTIFTELDSDKFVYIDRGSIVNLSHVVGIKSNFVELNNNICLPASHVRLMQIKEKLGIFWDEQT